MLCSKFLKKHFPVLFGAFALQMLFFGLAYNFKNIYLNDSPEYLFQAENLKNHLSLYSWKWEEPFLLQKWTLRTPAYGSLIFLIQKISNSHFAILLLQNILAFLNFIGLLWLLKDIKISKVHLNIALFLGLIFFPTRLVYTNMIMSEILFETCLFWTFFSFVLYVKSKKTSYILACNILLALAVLTKPVLLYFWLPNMIFMFYLFLESKQKRILLYSIIMPFCILFLCFYNLKTTGYFHYSSIKTINLVNYNTQILLAEIEGLEYAKKTVRIMHAKYATYQDLKLCSELVETECFAILRKNIPLYSVLQLRGMANFFLDPGRYDLYHFLPPLHTKEELSFFNQFREYGFDGIVYYFSKLSIPLVIYLVLIMIVNIITTIGFFTFYSAQRPIGR